MQVALTHTPDATATLTLRGPRGDVDRLAGALAQLRPEDFDAWNADFRREVDQAWQVEIARQRRHRNVFLMLGVTGLFNAPNLVAGLSSDSALMRATSWSGLLAIGWSFASAGWNTLDLTINPRARRAQEG